MSCILMLRFEKNGENLNIIKILDLENDGLNMAVDNQFLHIRCKRSMYKYNLTDMSLISQNVIFKKDGKARNFSICEKFIFLIDFCDLFILDINNLQVIENIRIGKDVSSDLGVVRFDNRNAYINIRNGKMAVMDIEMRAISKFNISDSSSWEHSVVQNRIYTGTVKGELIETDTNSMQLIRKIELCKKIFTALFIRMGLYIQYHKI